jgi:hypothetical protein
MNAVRIPGLNSSDLRELEWLVKRMVRIGIPCGGLQGFQQFSPESVDSAGQRFPAGLARWLRRGRPIWLGASRMRSAGAVEGLR